MRKGHRQKSRTCQGHDHPSLPWVLNSEAPLAHPPTKWGRVSDLPGYQKSAPLHMPAEPKRMELAGCSPGEILFVCFLPARVSLLLLPIDLQLFLSLASPGQWPRSTLKCFFSSLDYIWWLWRYGCLGEEDKFSVIGQNLFLAPKAVSFLNSYIYIYIYIYICFCNEKYWKMQKSRKKGK